MKKHGHRRMHNVVYHTKVVKKDILKLSKTIRLRIKKSIEAKLQIEPELYGKRLRKPYAAYYKLRVGDYRIVYKVAKKKVFILGIMHRKDIYQDLVERLAGVAR